MELNEKHGVIAVAAVVFLIIILSIWFFLSKEPAATATNCPVDEKKYLAGHTYIIVDQTGGFTDNQQRQLRSVIYDFAINKNKLKKYEKLTIIPLAQKKVVVLDSDSMKFNYCRPELGKNKRFSDEEYKKKFMYPLKNVFTELKEAKTIKGLTLLSSKLNKETLKFELKAGEEDKLFGSVTAQMISDELQNKGYSIDKKDIIMDESIKSIGNHYVIIHLGEDLDSKVKIKVKSGFIFLKIVL